MNIRNRRLRNMLNVILVKIIRYIFVGKLTNRTEPITILCNM